MSLPHLPLDIIVNILRSLPIERSCHSPSVATLVSCLATNQLFREAASLSSLWEPHYRVRYRHSDEEKDRERKLRFSDDWKELYATRGRLDKKALALLRGVIERPHSRMDAVREVLCLGMDVWDMFSFILKEIRTACVLDKSNSQHLGPYPLSKRYWADILLTGITKQDALSAWLSMAHSPKPEEAMGFERTLSYFSSFFGIPKEDISDRLAELGDGCRQDLLRKGRVLDAGDPNYNLEEICVDICTFMRCQGFVPAMEGSFHQLLNKFPHAYLTTHRATIAMSLIHVFVSLCRQIGIQAYPINFPGTIIAYVPTGSDSPPLIVNLWTGNAENAVMNNRPEWQSDAAFPFPVFPGPNDAILRPCTNPVPMLKRSSYNILNSIQVDPTIDSHDRQAAIMAVLYVGLVLTDDTFVYRNLSNLPLVDCLILYRNLLPKLNDEHQAAFNEHCVKAIQQEESKIAALDAPKRRASSSRPKYFVGMAMNHLKYNYRGVIFGWTPKCEAPEEWIENMDVDSLAGGRSQPFYHVFSVNELNPRSLLNTYYVAEENIKPRSLDAELGEILLNHIPDLPRYFGKVEFPRGKEGFGRFVPSPEMSLEYPDEIAYGQEWARKWKEENRLSGQLGSSDAV